MPTYNASDLATKQVASIAQAAVFAGRVTPGANTATGDILRPCRLPAGFRLLTLFVNVVTAFGATAPAKIGFSHVDGSASGQDTAVALLTDTTHASPGVKTLVPAADALTAKDAYLEVVFGTVATPASGDAKYVAIGEWHGSK